MRKIILNILAFLVGALLLPHLFLLQAWQLGYDFPMYLWLLLLLGGIGGLITRRLLLRRSWNRDRVADLAQLVRTMRRIHLLLFERKGRDELLADICRILVEEGHYLSAWLVLLNEEGGLLCCAESGFGGDFSRVRREMAKGRFPACADEALAGSALVVRNPENRCPGCILPSGDSSRVCLTIRLSFRDKVYGLLSVSTAAPCKNDQEEQRLFAEIAQDAGQALYLLELEAHRAVTENRFQGLVEHCLAGILLIQDNSIIYRNPEQKRLFGPLPAKFRPSAFLGVHPDDLLKVEEAYGMVSRGEAASVDVDFRFYPQGKGDRDMRWVFCRASRIDYQGRDTVLVNMIDITRNRELEQLVRIQDKMSSLGRVAAGIAHEVRNPLAGINIYLDTLAKIHARGENLETAGEIIAQAQAAARKIEAVIKRVMDFSRPGNPQLILSPVNEPVENALALCLSALRRDGISLERELAPDLPSCLLDPGLLEQVLLNLLTNAIEALRQTEKKIIAVATWLEDGKVMIRVGDSGPGISEEYRDRIFEPFYTTKAEGTGIGLSLCRRIISDHHGSLTVGESVLGGTEFVIALNAAEQRGEMGSQGGSYGAV